MRHARRASWAAIRCTVTFLTIAGTLCGCGRYGPPVRVAGDTTEAAAAADASDASAATTAPTEDPEREKREEPGAGDDEGAR